jgi:cytochrome c oxidase subunit 1
LTENFPEIPIMDHEAYDYEWLEEKNLAQQRQEEVV